MKIMKLPCETIDRSGLLKAEGILDGIDVPVNFGTKGPYGDGVLSILRAKKSPTISSAKVVP